MSGTLIVAVLGLSLSAISLTWQVVAYVLVGPRIRCSIGLVFKLMDESGSSKNSTAEITIPAEAWKREMLEAIGFSGDLGQFRLWLAVSVSNSGRTSISVDGVGIAEEIPQRWWSLWRTPHRTGSVMSGNWGSDQEKRLPARLEYGESHRWTVPLNILPRSSANGNTHAVVRAFVQLGSGKRVWSTQAWFYNPAELKSLVGDIDVRDYLQ